MLSPDRTPDEIIQEAMDVIAFGYPYDGSDEEKVAFMETLRKVFEHRAPMVREAFREA